MICYKCITRQQCDERQNEIGKLIISLIEKNWGSHYKNNNQPERSKREDLSLDKIINILEYALQPYRKIGEAKKELENLLSELKMRCSEHCGNTVRGK